MVKEESGFRKLLRNFFSAEQDDDKIFETASVEEKSAWKKALENSDKIMEASSESGKNSKKKASTQKVEIKQPQMNQTQRVVEDKELEL